MPITTWSSWKAMEPPQSRVERRAGGLAGLWEVGILADVRGCVPDRTPVWEGRRALDPAQGTAYSEEQGTFA